jgi:hypothetical protein
VRVSNAAVEHEQFALLRIGGRTGAAALLPNEPGEVEAVRLDEMQVGHVEAFGRDPAIATSSEYRLRRPADFGVDVIARRNGGDGEEVASCRCYEEATPTQLSNWSDELPWAHRKTASPCAPSSALRINSGRRVIGSGSRLARIDEFLRLKR